MPTELDAARLAQRNITTYSTDPDQGTEEDRARKRKVAAFHQLAMRRWETVANAEKTLRNEQREDLRWRYGGEHQWDQQARSDREAAGRPWLTINRFPQAINQLTNAERENAGGIQVHPVDSGADIRTAEVFQGIIRHIEEKSSAKAIYANAATWQAIIGRGYWRIVTEPVNDRSFDRHVRLKMVANPFQVYCDPSASEPDRRDIRFAFISVNMPGDEYDEKFGKESRASLEKFQSESGSSKPDWQPEGSILVSEYWYVEEHPDRLLQLVARDPAVDQLARAMYPNIFDPILMSELPPEWKGTIPEGYDVLDERPTMRREVRWALIDAEKILQGNADKTEGRKWDGRWIPIVQIIGDEINMDGKVDYRGIVRDGRDPQRVYNYEVTSLVETVQLGQTAPWIGYAGQFKGHEKKWNTANTKKWPYLEVEAVMANGQIAPLPQRIVQEPPIMAIAQAILQADNDFKVTTRWNDASLGKAGPQESGIAIERRQRQDQQSNAHYPDNMNQAKKFTGDLLIDLIPKTYDTPRILRILGDDDKPQTVMIHGAAGAPDPQEVEGLGVEGIYDLSVGTYDVVTSTGPSHQTQRMEVADHLTTILSKQPELFTMFADIYFEVMESPIAMRLAKRAKRLLPEQFQDDEGREDMPAGAARQIDQLSQQLQQAQQELQSAQQALMIDAEKAKVDRDVAETRAQATMQATQAEVAGRERVEQLRGQVRLLEAQIKAAGASSIEQVKAQLEERLARIQASLDTAREHATIRAEHRSDVAQLGIKHRSEMEQIAAKGATDMAGRLLDSRLSPREPSTAPERTR